MFPTWLFLSAWKHICLCQCLFTSLSNSLLCSSRSFGQHPKPGSLLHWLHKADTAWRTLPHCWILFWCLRSLWNVLPAASTTKCFPCTQQFIPFWWVSFLCGSIYPGKGDKENLLSGNHALSSGLVSLEANSYRYEQSENLAGFYSEGFWKTAVDSGCLEMAEG